MTIIVFLIDTSASMNQRVYLGRRPTLLDVAKEAVETFVKVRQRSPESRGDRYMLLTFEDPPAHIKAGWKENLATFMNELKNLQCVGMTTMGAALKHTFDVLNINRMQTGIDTYGQGRCPFYLEPSVIVVITDGGKLSTSTGVQEDFNLPMHSPIPGSELTREPFRWDQRLFSLVLRLAGTPSIGRDIGHVPNDTSPIDAMCEVTGGRSYSITSHRMLMQCIDSLVQKVQSGVVINFEKIGPDPLPINVEGKDNADGLIIDETEKSSEREWDKEFQQTEDDGIKNGSRLPNGTTTLNNNTAWHSCRRLIYVPRSAQKGFAVGFWPIPESFWPDLSSSSLPPRTAHPNVKFTCTSQEPMVIESLPFDKYELEPSPMTQFILSRKQPTTCWQVFVANSYKNSDVGHPFGYLKASTNLTCVNLFVMPYNYPVLMPLLDDLTKVHRMKPTNEWRAQFQNYLRTMPSYYAGPLRRALTRMGVMGTLAQSLVPDTLDNSLSYSVLNYLKRLKNQAKMEFERLCSEVGSKNPNNSGGKLNQNSSSVVTDGIRVTARSSLKKDLVSHPLLQDKFTSLREQLNEFGGFVVGLVRGQCQKGRQSYRNPYDIPRHCLLDQVVRMRANFLQPSLAHTKLVDEGKLNVITNLHFMTCSTENIQNGYVLHCVLCELGDHLHSMPVGQMGNYQEYLKRMTPQLREIESTPVRQHMFGNPFKIDKRMMVDEADIEPVTGSSAGHSSGGSHRGTKRGASHLSSDLASGRPPNKRKPGPIPKDTVVRRPSSPFPLLPLTSPSSPGVPPASPPPWPPTAFSADLAPPVLSPVVSVPGHQPSPPASPADAGRDEPERGVEPPKLVLVNGDIGDNSIQALNGPPRSRSPSPPNEVIGHVLPEPVNNHISDTHSTPLFLRPSPPSSPALVNHFAYSTNESEDRKSGLNPSEVGSNHIGTLGEVSIVPAKQLTKKELGEIRKHNLNVRAMAYKEIRRPGKNFGPLFNILQDLKGSLEVRVALLRDVINESLRFKRRSLALLLEEFLETMMSTNNRNSLTFINPPTSNGLKKL